MNPAFEMVTVQGPAIRPRSSKRPSASVIVLRVPARGLCAAPSAPLSTLPSGALTTRPERVAPEGTFVTSGAAGRCACGFSQENARSTTQSGTIGRPTDLFDIFLPDALDPSPASMVVSQDCRCAEPAAGAGEESPRMRPSATEIE